MLVLTDQERIGLAKNVSYILSLYEDGANMEQILSLAYREFLPDKSGKQGDLMARRILDKMEEFITAEELADADAGILAAYQIDRLMEGKNLQEQCAAAHCFIQGLDYFDQELIRSLSREGKCVDGVQSEKWTPYTGPVTEEARNRLRDQAIQSVAHASLSDETLKKLGQMLKEGGTDAGTVLSGRCNDYLFQATSAMVIYCMAKQGQLSQVPREISLDQVVYTVCAGESMRQLVGAMEAGMITVEQYVRRLTIWWKVIRTLLACAVVAVGIVTSFMMMSGQFFLGGLTLAIMMTIQAYMRDLERESRSMIAIDAVSLVKIDVSVKSYSEEILNKYRETQQPPVPEIVPEQSIRQVNEVVSDEQSVYTTT